MENNQRSSVSFKEKVHKTKELVLQLMDLIESSSESSQAISIPQPRLNRRLSPIYENPIRIDDIDSNVLLCDGDRAPNPTEQAHDGGTNSSAKASEATKDSDETEKPDKKQMIADMGRWFQTLNSLYEDKIKEKNKDISSLRNSWVGAEMEVETLREKYNQAVKELVQCKAAAFKNELAFQQDRILLLRENGPIPYIDLAIDYLKALSCESKEDLEKCQLQKNVDEIIDFVKKHSVSPHVTIMIKRLTNLKNGTSAKKTPNVLIQCDSVTASYSSMEDEVADVVPSHDEIIEEPSTSASATQTLRQTESVTETLPVGANYREEGILNAVQPEVGGCKSLQIAKSSDKNYNGSRTNSAEFMSSKKNLSRGASDKRNGKSIEQKSQSKLKKAKTVNFAMIQESGGSENPESVGNTLIISDPSNGNVEPDLPTSSNPQRSQAELLIRKCVVRVKKINCEESGVLPLLGKDSSESNKPSNDRVNRSKASKPPSCQSEMNVKTIEPIKRSARLQAKRLQ